ncbi:response regulator [Cohnella ginsengisoli]|uniref:Response regulator n=1 Tax=Cohnella ginsengisoli TaxID=425004 RepID=A0A9X4QMM0_9BACL|nr:response regulator [Cohnella ginsengisoli]MDG0792184.1 response regulator [Cohnella ginsengisoli]
MKILVVDDETLIRESIVTLLSAIGRFDVEEARDGIEAFETIGRERPDIVIADIRMPGMDGHALLAKVKEMKWDALFIFVSGYDVFEYARQAVRLGAFGYLLKPIKDQELKEALAQAMEQRAYGRQERQRLSRMESAMNQGIHFMRKHFLLELARGSVLSDRYIQDKFGELNIHLPASAFTVLYLSIDDYKSRVSELGSKEKETLKFSLENIALEILTDRGVIAYSFELEDGLGILTNYAPDHPAADPDRFYELCAEINRCISRFTKITATIGIGAEVDHWRKIRPSFESAEQAVMQRMVQGMNRVIRRQEAASEAQGFNAISLKKEQALIRIFEQGDETAALQFIEELFAPFRAAGVIDVNRLMKLHFQLIMLQFKILRHLGFDPEGTLGDEFALYSQVNACPDIDAVVQWFASKTGVCFELVRAKQDKGHSHLIDKAKAYIHQNFSKEITLESLADHVHLSPPYLSKLFKEEAGENFSAYLLNYRMGVACELLREGVHKAHQVAEMVGFQNEKYFFKVFKREIGLTPSEYRNL